MESPGEPPNITIAAWSDPVVEQRGHHVNSLYVEFFWLPVMGPSAILLLRRCALFTCGRRPAVTLSADLMSTSLGLGAGSSRNAPLPRAIERCIRFGAARRSTHGRLEVRSVLSDLSEHHVSRLHPALRRLHAEWDSVVPQAEASLDST